MFKPALMLAVAIGTQLPHAALACACCADPGTRATYHYDSSEDFLPDFQEMQFAGPANVYVTACGLECVEGVDMASDQYEAHYAIDADQITLTFSAEGNSGTIHFAVPESITTTEVDTTLDADNFSPILYKELRSEFTATGDGIFASLANGVPAELILQGHGNACTPPTDYTHWRFEVAAEGIAFAIYGKLVWQGY